MKLYRNIDDFPLIDYPVVTTGGFDGVHTGHKEILKELVRSAKENNGESIIITFSPHPRLVIYPGNDIKILTTDDEKIELLSDAGIDNLIIEPFTKEFVKLTSEKFIKNILYNKLHTKKLIIGYNHHFGNDRKGDYDKLTEYSKIYNFEIDKISEYIVQNISVSSTKIRDYLNHGKISQANALLGYEYNITGKVIEGNNIGMQLGFPTANIAVNDSNKLVPPTGVYAVRIKHKSQFYYGMLYIGYRPTVSSDNFAIEVNIFNFNKEIYNEILTIYFIERIRDDRKFENIDKLKEQIIIDKQTILKILNLTHN